MDMYARSHIHCCSSLSCDVSCPAASESYGGHFSVQLLDELHLLAQTSAHPQHRALYRRIKGA